MPPGKHPTWQLGWRATRLFGKYAAKHSNNAGFRLFHVLNSIKMGFGNSTDRIPNPNPSFLLFNSKVSALF
jgi:hypothetical protein